MKRRDPYVTTVATSLALVVAGFVAIALGKRVVARTLLVYDQIPAVISGGLVGVGLILCGCVLFLVQTARRLEAQARISDERTLDELSAVVKVLRDRPKPPPPAPAKATRSRAKAGAR